MNSTAQQLAEVYADKARALKATNLVDAVVDVRTAQGMSKLAIADELEGMADTWEHDFDLASKTYNNAPAVKSKRLKSCSPQVFEMAASIARIKIESFRETADPFIGL